MAMTNEPEDLNERVERLERTLAATQVAAEQAQRQLAALLDMLGWTYEPLPIDPEGIQKMLQEIDEVVSVPVMHLDLEQLRKWSRMLLRITPPYLTLVSQQLALEMPWRPFLELSHQLLQKAELDDVASAPLIYGALDVARRNVQQAAYLWSKEQRGRLPAAPEVVDGTLDAVLLEMHTFLFPHRVG